MPFDEDSELMQVDPGSEGRLVAFSHKGKRLSVLTQCVVDLARSFCCQS
jgi:hypothetical protein